jgi:hypothetical protein
MSAVPLSPHDLADELRSRYGDHGAARPVVFFASGDPGDVLVTIAGEATRVPVVPVHCELELRAGLLRSPPVVLLVDYTTHLPPDVRARLLERKGHFPNAEGRLRRKFSGAMPTTDLLVCTPLCRALLQDPEEVFRVESTSVNLEAAFRALLGRRADFPTHGALSVERMLGFCATSPDPRGFRRVLQQDPELREAWLGLLDRVAGKVACIVWRAWERGEGRKAAALALILEVTTRQLAGYVRGSLVQILERLEPGLGRLVASEPKTLERWGEAAEPLVRSLDARQRNAVLDEAATLLPDPEAGAALKESRVLRQSLAYWRSRLGALLKQLAKEPQLSELRQAYEAERHISNHILEGEQTSQRSSQRRKMALRLAGYLAWAQSPAAQLPQHGPSYEAAVALAARYAEHGGFVDYAREIARSQPRGPDSDDALDGAVAQLVRAVDALRDRQDALFAQALPAWLGAGRPHDRVMPIEEVLDRVAVPFLAASPRRKLLVLLLDGMSWANAVEIADGLVQRPGLHFAPLRWHPERVERIPAVMAALPTVTEVSRAAFFAGKLPAPGSTLSTAKDRERFAQHAGLQKICDKAPTLLLRPELQTRTGDASSEALDRVRSDERVVGVVVNAIDEQLHGSSQLHVAHDHESIKPLEPLLLAAAESGRAILLAADHGHIPGSRLAHVGAGPRNSGGGSRWRPLAAAESAQPHEVRIDQAGVWRPRGQAALALLFRETDTYGSAGSAGEHGGASLAEVVAPVLLIGAEDLSGLLGEDRELEVQPLQRPTWWDFELAGAEGLTPTSQPTARASTHKPSKEPSPQLVMPAVMPPLPAAPVPASSAGSPSLPKALLQALGTGAQKEQRAAAEKAQQAISLLLSVGGQMGADAFANKLGLLPSRVPGFVVELDERLNLDGNQVIRYDRVGRQVTLAVDLLKSLYGT